MLLGKKCICMLLSPWLEYILKLCGLSIKYWICRCADDKPYVPTYHVSKEKAESLGIEFISLDVSLKETVESLKEKGFVNF